MPLRDAEGLGGGPRDSPLPDTLRRIGVESEVLPEDEKEVDRSHSG